MLDFEAKFEITNPAPKNLLLSIVIPTFNRPVELKQALDSMLSQLVDGLEDKIEIILSDNASTDAGTREVCEAYVEKSKNVSYYQNAENYGHMKQIILGPNRARGEFCWVFGDDDIILDNCFHSIINMLDTADADFFSINRETRDGKLDEVMTDMVNVSDSYRYDTMATMLERYGVHQLGFITSQLFRTSVFLEINPALYIKGGAGYQQVAAYIDGFYDRPCYYLCDVLIAQRYVVTTGKEQTLNLANNFSQLAAPFVRSIETARANKQIPESIYVKMTAVKTYTGISFDYTLEDQVIEYTYRALGYDHNFDDDDLTLLENVSVYWSEQVKNEFEKIKVIYQKLIDIDNRIKSLEQQKNQSKKLNKNQKRKRNKALNMKIEQLNKRNKEIRIYADNYGLNYYISNANKPTGQKLTG